MITIVRKRKEMKKFAKKSQVFADINTECLYVYMVCMSIIWYMVYIFMFIYNIYLFCLVKPSTTYFYFTMLFSKIYKKSRDLTVYTFL